MGDLPIGELLLSLARGLAAGQRALDQTSIEHAEALARTTATLGTRLLPDGTRAPWEATLLELGFVPTFYAFAETVFELAILPRLVKDPAGGVTLQAVPLEAGAAQTFRVRPAAASRLRFTIVPVPPPELARLDAPPKE